MCREGTSAGKKRRLFYFPSEHYFYCFNCARSWSEIDWIAAVTGQDSLEVIKSSKKFITNITPTSTLQFTQESDIEDVVIQVEEPPVPADSINILDDEQIGYYKGRDENKLISKALEYCKQRRILTACNKPQSLYVSYKDPVHAKRLIIPFYNENGKIQSYQSRSLDSSQTPKYLTKYGEKCFFGENAIDNDSSVLFVTEGPIDAMFVKNCLGAGGAKITNNQKIFLAKHFDKEIVYIFDNDKKNTEMQKTIIKVISDNKKIFIWPKEFKKFKDLNEVCCHLGVDVISNEFLLKNSYSGVEAMLKYKLSLSYI